MNIIMISFLLELFTEKRPIYPINYPPMITRVFDRVAEMVPDEGRV